MSVRALPLAAMLCAMVCQTGTRGPDPAQVRRVIDETNQRLERFYAEGKIDSAAMCFAEDVWQMPPNAPPLRGRRMFEAFWTQAVGWGTWRFDLNAEDVVVEDSIAVERGAYTLSFEPGPDAPIPASSDRGNFLVLWRLEGDGVWRIVWEAPVSELPLGGARQ